MVMEYMQGGDLGTALARDSASPRRLGWHNRGRHIALGIARGLMYLHAQKVAPLSRAAQLKYTAYSQIWDYTNLWMLTLQIET